MTAVALRQENAFERPLHDRQEILTRYRHMRRVSGWHLNNAVQLLSNDAVLQQAKRLGLAYGKTFVLGSKHEMKLAFDLLVFTAAPGRSRAIDRYAAPAGLQQGTDEALMLEAMRKARFVIFKVKQRHPSAGLIVSDVFRETELWLVDEGLESSLPDGVVYATRIYATNPFVMAAGIGMPVDPDLLKDAITSMPRLMRNTPSEVIDDRRFAEAIYRTALADHVMESVRFQDPGENE